MKKFIFKSTLFLLGGLILIRALAFVADSLAPDGSTRFLLIDQHQMEQLLDQPQQLEAIAIGNSHAGSINLEVLGYHGHKIERADNDFFELQYYLEKLLPRMPQVQTVFIPVSYFLFHQDNLASKEVEIRRADMYTVIPSWGFMEGDFDHFVIGKSRLIFPIVSILREDNWQDIFFAIVGKAPRERKINVGLAEHDCDYMEVEDLIKNAQSKRVARYMRLTAEMIANHPDLETDTFETLAETIQYLQARNLRVIFFTPPYFEAYTEYYQSVNPEMIALMKQNMQILQWEYGIEYYDFSMDREFISNNHLFADPDHLNGCGAKLFSAKFKRVLAEHERVLAEHE